MYTLYEGPDGILRFYNDFNFVHRLKTDTMSVFGYRLSGINHSIDVTKSIPIQN